MVRRASRNLPSTQTTHCSATTHGSKVQQPPSLQARPCALGLCRLPVACVQATREPANPRPLTPQAGRLAGPWLAHGLLMAVAIEAAAHRGPCGPIGRNPPSTDRTLLTLGPSPKVPQGCLQGCLLLRGWVTSAGGQEPGSTNINGHSDHGRSSLARYPQGIVFGRSQASQAGQGCTDSGPAPTDLPGTKDGQHDTPARKGHRSASG